MGGHGQYSSHAAALGDLFEADLAGAADMFEGLVLRKMWIYTNAGNFEDVHALFWADAGALRKVEHSLRLQLFP